MQSLTRCSFSLRSVLREARGRHSAGLLSRLDACRRRIQSTDEVSVSLPIRHCLTICDADTQPQSSPEIAFVASVPAIASEVEPRSYPRERGALGWSRRFGQARQLRLAQKTCLTHSAPQGL